MFSNHWAEVTLLWQEYHRNDVTSFSALPIRRIMMFRCLTTGDSDFDYLFKIFSADFPIAKLLFYTSELIGNIGKIL